jgi:pimeloyl-ACP methyl ester carboxylesterase
MTSKMPQVDPKKVMVPTLVISGQYDGNSTVADLQDFFGQLPNGDHQLIILPGVAHSVVLATNRQLFWHATKAFLTMPTPIST